MLWLALHFPALAVEVFSRASDAALPLAVTEQQRNRPWVVAANDAAADFGIRPGMAASAAQALADGLILRPRDPTAEAAALEGLAVWAGRFTPSVRVKPPDGLLLEVGSCLSLHRGLGNLRRLVGAGLGDMAFSANVAGAPTALAAWLFARAGLDVVLREPDELERMLAALPVELLEPPRDVAESLALIGAETIGDVLALPRAGAARRFGQALLDQIDRARGRLPEAHAFFVPPPHFARRLELPAAVENAEALLFAARRLLPELEGFLVQRQAGVQAAELVCRHERRAPTVVSLGFVKPVRAAERMQLLLRETLWRTALPAPVYAITLKASRIQPLTATSHDLFGAASETGDPDLLLDRLQARLGREAVYGIAPVADHRPERAWRRAEAGSKPPAPRDTPRRPLWLLPRPVPCRDGDLVLQGGMERIESGWWDGRDADRDYYVAQDRRGARLWVYCERASGEWFVHGLFA